MGIGHELQTSTSSSHLPVWLLKTSLRPDEAAKLDALERETNLSQ